MQDFFQRRKLKCDTCVLRRKAKTHPVACEIRNPFYIETGKKEVLVVVEYPHKHSALLQEQMDHLVVFFKKYLPGIAVDFIAGLECEPQGKWDETDDEMKYPIPSPLYGVYTSCNTTPVALMEQYRVVIPMGRALFAVTHSDDITTWEEFSEFIFNDTFFLTPDSPTRNRTRVYPVASPHEFIGKNNFEILHAKKQCRAVLDYLRAFEPIIIPEYHMVHVEDPNAFLREHLDDPRPVAYDTETNGLNMVRVGFKPICLTLCFDGVTGYYLDWDLIDKELLQQFFHNRVTYTANGKYDSKVLKWNSELLNWMGVDVATSEDVILGFHMLSTERIHNSLKTLAFFVGFGGYEAELEVFKKKRGIKDYSLIPFDILFPYAVKDAIVTFRLKQLMDTWGLRQPELMNDAYRRVIRVIPVFQRMEMTGELIDVEQLNIIDAKLRKKEDILIRQVKKLLKKEFDVSSPKQLAEVLEEARWRCLGRVKTGYYKTGEAELLTWAKMPKSSRIAKKLLHYRKTTKLRTAFIGTYLSEDDKPEVDTKSLWLPEEDSEASGIAKAICFDTRIHPSYGPGMTDTLRTRAGGGESVNPMQFPSQKYEGKLFKRVRATPKGFRRFKMDYAGFQIRIIGILSKDENLIESHTNPAIAGKDLRKADPHSKTAVTLFRPEMTIQEFQDVKNKQPYEFERHTSKTCFAEGTLIETSQGTLPVESFIPEVNAGMLTPYLSEDVLLLDRFGKSKTIEFSYFGYSEELIDFELENGDVISVTPEHRFKIKRQGKEIEVRADHVLASDEFLTDTPITQKTNSIKRRKAEPGKPFKVYCFVEPVNHECLIVGKSGQKFVSLQCNFSLAFGTSPRTFAETLQTIWTPQFLESFLSRNGLEVGEDGPWFEAAKFIHAKFFEGYPRLMPFIKECQREGYRNGYVDGWFGSRRHVPYMLVSGDADYDRKKMSNYKNIAVNSRIQSIEALLMYESMVKIQERLDRDKMQSTLFGMTHDSVDGYVHESEVDMIESLLRECCENYNYTIPFLIDVHVDEKVVDKAQLPPKLVV